MIPGIPILMKEEKKLKTKVKDDIRRGKWTPEEEAYAIKLIEVFNGGLLRLSENEIANGITLRAFLAKKLNCDPMRITKKFSGEFCLGKQSYHNSSCVIPMNILEEVIRELNQLEKNFKERDEKNKQDKINRDNIEREKLNPSIDFDHVISSPAIDAMLRSFGSVPSTTSAQTSTTHPPPNPIKNLMENKLNMPVNFFALTPHSGITPLGINLTKIKTEQISVEMIPIEFDNNPPYYNSTLSQSAINQQYQGNFKVAVNTASNTAMPPFPISNNTSNNSNTYQYNNYDAISNELEAGNGFMHHHLNSYTQHPAPISIPNFNNQLLDGNNNNNNNNNNNTNYPTTTTTTIIYPCRNITSSSSHQSHDMTTSFQTTTSSNNNNNSNCSDNISSQIFPSEKKLIQQQQHHPPLSTNSMNSLRTSSAQSFSSSSLHGLAGFRFSSSSLTGFDFSSASLTAFAMLENSDGDGEEGENEEDGDRHARIGGNLVSEEDVLGLCENMRRSQSIDEKMLFYDFAGPDQQTLSPPSISIHKSRSKNNCHKLLPENSMDEDILHFNHTLNSCSSSNKPYNSNIDMTVDLDNISTTWKTKGGGSSSSNNNNSNNNSNKMKTKRNLSDISFDSSTNTNPNADKSENISTNNNSYSRSSPTAKIQRTSSGSGLNVRYYSDAWESLNSLNSIRKTLLSYRYSTTTLTDEDGGRGGSIRRSVSCSILVTKLKVAGGKLFRSKSHQFSGSTSYYGNSNNTTTGLSSHNQSIGMIPMLSSFNWGIGNGGGGGGSSSGYGLDHDWHSGSGSMHDVSAAICI